MVTVAEHISYPVFSDHSKQITLCAAVDFSLRARRRHIRLHVFVDANVETYEVKLIKNRQTTL